jgi:outer membrane lipoprotein-sorting protein
MMGRRQSMRLGKIIWLGATVALALAGLEGASAQDSKAAKQNPVGGPAWNAKVNQDTAVASVTLDAKQLEAVKQVSVYFNDLANLKGNFLQTSADNKRLRGKFYVKRPGRLRFEYSLPSRQLIVSDGQQLAIQDLDINTDDRLALDQTPFRILLRKDVDLLRDANISEVQETDDLVIVTLQDKSPDAPGKIRLFLSKAPVLELKEWVTSDSQGLDTRVEVSSLNTKEDLDAALFKIVNPSLLKKSQ